MLTIKGILLACFMFNKTIGLKFKKEVLIMYDNSESQLALS